MPMPLLADACTASVQSMPTVCSTSSATRSGSAAGRSILLSTGTISRSLSIARYTLASVCASTPCDASTTSNAPSQAARLRLTYSRSTCLTETDSPLLLVAVMEGTTNTQTTRNNH
eukprot:scaffold743_cov267-Pinguiococcus_pyrenoidosus.AAC.27